MQYEAEAEVQGAGWADRRPREMGSSREAAATNGRTTHFRRQFEMIAREMIDERALDGQHQELHTS